MVVAGALRLVLKGALATGTGAVVEAGKVEAEGVIPPSVKGALVDGAVAVKVAEVVVVVAGANGVVPIDGLKAPAELEAPNENGAAVVAVAPAVEGAVEPKENPVVGAGVVGAGRGVTEGAVVGLLTALPSIPPVVMGWPNIPPVVVG